MTMNAIENASRNWRRVPEEMRPNVRRGRGRPEVLRIPAAELAIRMLQNRFADATAIRHVVAQYVRILDGSLARVMEYRTATMPRSKIQEAWTDSPE